MDKNLHSLFTAFTLLCVFFFAACEDYTDPALYAPQVTTGEVVASTLSRKEATLTGHIVMPNIKAVNSVGFRYSIYSTMEVPSEVIGTVNGETISMTITGLEPNTHYYYYAFASGGFNEQRGQVREFTTSQYDAPSLGQIVADQVGRTSMHVSSALLDDGGETTVTSIGFIYYPLESQGVLPTPEYIDEKGTRIAYARDVTIGQKFELEIDKLLPDTEYALCAYATSVGKNTTDKRTGYSDAIRVRTAEDVDVPSVDIVKEVSTDETEMELSSSILNDGRRPVTECGFCWSTSVSVLPNIQGSHTKATLTGDSFQAKISGLEPGTTYYVRAYAINDQGVGYSTTVVSMATLQYDLPTLSIPTMSAISEHSARATAYIRSTGNSEITDRGFCISSTNMLPDEKDRVISLQDQISQMPALSSAVYSGNMLTSQMNYYLQGDNGEDAHPAALPASVSEENLDIIGLIDNLERGTKYYIRAYAVNAKKGINYSDSISFTTADYRTAPAVDKVTAEVDETFMTLHSSVSGNGDCEVTERGFCWSETNMILTLENSTHQVASGDDGGFQLTVSDLTPGTTYYVRAYAINEKGVGYSALVEPVHLPQYAAPTLSATTVSNVEEYSAKATAYITDSGNADITESGFCISATNANPTKSDRVIYVNPDNNKLETIIDNLERGKHYYICAFATNRKGTGYGSAEEFDMADYRTGPAVDKVFVDERDETYMKLRSSVVNDGGSTVSERGFCWSETNSLPTLDDTHKAASGDNGSFLLTVSDLTPGTTYYVRAYAINDKGTGYSASVEPVELPQYAMPTLSTTTLTNVEEYSAKATAYITDSGNAEITESGFCISATNANPTKNDRVVYVNPDNNKLETIFDNLERGKHYYVCAFATNRKGTSYGNVEEFETADHRTGPAVDKVIVEERDETYMKLFSYVVNDGESTVSERGFCWSETNTMPTLDDSHQVASGDNGGFRLTVSGLTPGKTYYVRAYAINEKGTGYSTSTEPVELPKYAKPTLSTTTLTNVEEYSAKATAYITDFGNAEITESGFCISSTNVNPTKNDRVVYVSQVNNKLETIIDNLERGKHYYVCAFATNRKGTTYGSAEEFETADYRTGPAVDKVTVEDRDETYMKLFSHVVNDGGSSVSERGFCWSETNTMPTLEDSHQTASGDNGGFRLTVSGLTPGRTYYVRAYAINEKGTGFSASVEPVELPKYAKPSVSKPIVTGITTTEATANASITDMGGLEITDRGFCVSQSHATPDMNDQVFHADADGASISSLITGLTPGTTYHIRAFATNRKGTTFSSSETFETAKLIVAPTVSNVTSSGKTQTTITVSATVTSTGNGTILEKGFCYMAGTGVVPTKQNALSVTDSSAGNGIQSTLTGLQPNTTYCIRAYARNEEGSYVYSAEVKEVITDKRGPSSDDVDFPIINE